MHVNEYMLYRKERKKYHSMKFPGNERQVFLYLGSDLNNQGKVCDFRRTTYISYISFAYLPRCRDTTYLITDKVSSKVLTRYCSTEMAFVSDTTTPLFAAINMADLTHCVTNSARISYYPKIVSEL